MKFKRRGFIDPMAATLVGAVVAIYIISSTLVPLLVESTTIYGVTNETFNATPAHTMLNTPLKLGSFSAYCAIDSAATLTRNVNYTLDEGTGEFRILALGAWSPGLTDKRCNATSIGVNYGYLKGAALPNLVTGNENSIVRVGVIMAAVAIFGIVVATLVV